MKSLNYPHFICIGPAKSATTWLADQLKPQFDMWFPPVQELSYPFLSFKHLQEAGHLEYRTTPWEIFKRVVRNKSLSGSRDRRFYDMAKMLADKDPNGNDMKEYARIFQLAEGKITGDISPIYASFTPDQIGKLEKETNCKIVFMFLRDPVARFFSHYRMMERYRKYDDADYGSAETVSIFLNDPVRSRQFYPSKIYANWSAIWGERFTVFDFDDVKATPAETLNRIIRHVGGNPRHRVPFIPPTINRNRAYQSTPFSEDAKRIVHAHFLTELEACYDLFGATAKPWLERSRAFLKAS
tara:strand:+ start:25375 stop:26268 length:894 start_codon:yes stop_codon:yes gene_type:complete